MVISSVDISSQGFGTNWSQTRVYSNQIAANGDHGQGYNWLVLNWPFAMQQGSPDQITIVRGTQASLWFDQVGSVFVGRYGTKSTLSHDSSRQVYVLTFPDGSVNEFQDFTVAPELRGAFVKQVSPTGNVTEVTDYTPTGQIAEIHQTGSVGGQPLTEAFVYDYDTNQRVTSVRLRRQLGMSAWVDILQAIYEYYATGESFGNVGDLKRMQRQVPVSSGWATAEYKYYRYYQPGDPNGFTHGLRYVVEPATYARMVAASIDPLTASNATMALFADNYFEYDSQQRAVLEQVDGASQTFSFEYTAGSTSTDTNVWGMKTIETLPDGNQNIVYSNLMGNPLIRDLKAGTDHWIDAYHYNDEGKLLWQASPSAVIGYDDTHPNLAISLRSDAGLISLTEYYTTSGSGAAAGYVSANKIRQGSSGTPITLATYEYSSQTADGSTFYFVASETVYRNDDLTGAIQTSYAYTFYSGTAQIQQQTTTLPVVPTDQNGSGVAATRKIYFNTWNQPTWSMDERGIITNQTFDLATGAVIQRIDDVDTSVVSGAPSGWSTPTGAGLNQVTDFLIDEFGRTVQSLGPVHEIDLSGTATNIRRASWTVFDDVQYQVARGQGYQSGSSPGATFELVNPVSVTVQDAVGKRLQEFQAASASTSGSLAVIVAAAGSISAAFPQTSYTRWTTYQYTDCCLTVSQRVYHTIPTSGSGSSGTNYDETDYGYDVMKRRNRTVTPGGTITDLVYEPRGLVIGIYVGTNDNGATETDPTGGGSDPANNMVLVTAKAYDDGLAGGDGNLTEVTQSVDSSTTRVTSMTYDFRNRNLTTDGEIDYFQKLYYDNLNRVAKTERYNTTAGGNLIARSETKFDDRGRVYQTIRYGVDPATGTVGNSLTDNSWYDAAGNVIKSQPAGSSLFTKNTIDSVGRTTIQYQGYDLDETSYADALTVTNDVILEQSEIVYDNASNVIQSTTRQRYHNAPDPQTGALQNPNTTPKARVTYGATWQDGVGRTVASANYGTNGGTALSRPSTIPAASDSVLVTLATFDSAGNTFDTTDPAGMVTRFGYDDVGRKILQIDNYQPSSSSSSSSSSSGGGCNPSDDTNRTTQFTFTPDGQQATLTAVNARTGDQTTTWTYGTTLSNSDVTSSQLLRSVTYPDSIGSSDVVLYSYNRQGEKRGMTDQRGCVHVYDYDLLGRQIHDRVTTAGSGVDTAVLRLSTTYEVRGMAITLTSWDSASVSAGSVVNQCQFAYNDFSQLITDYQEHSGAVNTSTTPKVQYGYTDGSANTIRPTTVTYPNGRVLTYGYGTTNGIDDAVSRVSSLVDDDVSATHLADYSFVGMGAYVVVDYTEPDVKYTLVDLSGTNDPDTGDIYSGWDRFGRVKDCRWYDDGNSTDTVRLKYGYDRASDRLWRADLVAQSLGKDFDELYSYDGLHRLKDMQRGLLNGTNTAVTSENFAQCWTLDPTSNWYGFQEAATGGSSTLVQTRTANQVNEISGITNSVGAAWINPAYDAAGNTTTIPQPADPTKGYTGTYDAWNRLVSLVDTSSSNTVQQNAYDARTIRTKRQDYTAGTLSETRHFYYTTEWQSIEERLGTSPDSANAAQQLVWGQRYVDDLVLRNRDANGDGILDERFYGLQDANWNMVALINTSAVAQERYQYTPFGVPAFLNGAMSAVLSDSAFQNDILFTGQHFDATPHLYLFRMRWLNSTTGTFVTRDPLNYPDGPNTYAAWFVPSNTDLSGTSLGDEYGNWCGTTHSNAAGDGTFIDALDQACMFHDQCLAKSWMFLIPCRRRVCDDLLCIRAVSAYWSGCDTSPTPTECQREAALIASYMCTNKVILPIPFPF